MRRVSDADSISAALTAAGQLPDEELELAGLALILARRDAPQADWRAAAAHLSVLAQVAHDRRRASHPAEALARIMARHGYQGDADTYDDLANANLIRVIERRRGLPVALGILWLHAAQAAGWEAFGLDVPGHLLLSIAGTVMDPFAGGAADARFLAGLARQAGHAGDPRALLRPMNNRAMLLRLQNNILLRREAAGDAGGARRVLADMARFAPDAPAVKAALDRLA
jgi:regulator of sirC expression with transglutaminase-like and TPR domain